MSNGWCPNDAHVWAVAATDPRRESCTRCPTWRWRVDLAPIAQDVVLLARAAIRENVSDASWRVIENLVRLAIEAVNDTWRVRAERQHRQEDDEPCR